MQAAATTLRRRTICCTVVRRDDAGYQGIRKREENLGLEVEWLLTMSQGIRRNLVPGSDEALVENARASVSTKVEHPVLKVKRLFGYGKVRY